MPTEKVAAVAKTLGESVKERGLSFIAAAELMVEHREGEFGTMPPKKKKIFQDIQAFWITQEDANLTAKNLATLQRTLIVALSPRDLKFSWTGSYIGKKIKDQLDNAENHISWKPRSPIETSFIVDETEFIRRETPIATFTDAQQQEYCNILEKETEPQWFKKLESWEQNYLKERLREWESARLLDPNTKQNLGEYLGPLSSTIRRYPGVANAYKTELYSVDKQGKSTLLFTKIRSATIAPVKMGPKGNRILVNMPLYKNKEKKQKIAAAKENLEQLVVAALKAKIQELKELKELKDSPKDISKIELPVLFQTLYTPPLQPPGAYNNASVMKAFNQLAVELGTAEKIQIFIKKHNISGPEESITFKKIDLLYSNRAVNVGRGLSWIINLISEQGRKSRLSDSVLKGYINKIKNDDLDKKILEEALKSYNSIPYIGNTLKSGLMPVWSAIRKIFGLPKVSQATNASAELAALEQIIASKVGVRVGGCVSGKDREEMVTCIALAQRTFYEKHTKFPPQNPKTDADKALRQEFVDAVAHIYLNTHGRELAAANAPGCEGLKNIEDVFAGDICKKIQVLAPNAVTNSQKIAGLNKISLEKIEEVDSRTFIQQVRDFKEKKSTTVLPLNSPAVTANTSTAVKANTSTDILPTSSLDTDNSGTVPKP